MATLAGSPQVALSSGTGTRSFTSIKTHPSDRGPLFSTAKPLHSGADGARNRAINIGISANIFRGTAASAIWNVR